MPYQKAADYLTDKIKAEPNNAQWRYGRALVLTFGDEEEDYDTAIADFTELIRRKPKTLACYKGRAAVWSFMGKLDKVIQDRTAVVKLDPKSPASFKQRGLAWSAKGEQDKAINDYNEAIRLNPKYRGAYHHRALEWRGKREYGKALDDYRMAIRLDRLHPGNAFIHAKIATILATCPDAKHRNGKLALRHAIKGCEQTGWRSSYLLSTLAAAHAEIGNFEEAIRRQALAIKIVANEKFAERSLVEYHKMLIRLYRQGKPRRTP